ncbi:MAG: DUF58 domain-containing protein [Eubacteriaceae bacterium]|nr:DUF58 domain-containing protein [Eubacteriaceae bacterium]
MIRKMMPPALGWVGVFIILFILYAFTASFVPVAVMTLMAVLSLFTWAMNFYTRKHISISIIPPATTPKNNDATSRIILTNSSSFPVSRCYVELIAKNTLTGETYTNTLILSASQKSDSERAFVINSDKCGYITVRTGKVILSDIFGFLPLRADISSEGKMSVLPDTFDMNISLGISFVSRMDEDTYSPDKSGNDFSETFQIREYIPGDSLKQIHWKLSDKLDKLMVREASLPISRSLLVFWDKNTCNALAEKMDCMAEVVSSLCQALCDEGVLYTLGWTDGDDNVFEEISVTDELFRSVGQMLKSGCNEGISGMERYCEEHGKAEFGKVIYITARIPDGFDSYIAGDATIMLCSDEGYDSEYNVITFNADTYITDISTVEL